MFVGLAIEAKLQTIMGVIYIFAAMALLAIAGIMYSIANTQNPVSGRVIDRYLNVSTFSTGDLPLDATLDDLLTGKLPELQELQVTYWLHVAPLDRKGKPNRWFTVTQEVFGTHLAGTDYNADNPATLTTSAPVSEEAPADK